jgi:predicted nucleic acid-binding protein
MGSLLEELNNVERIGVDTSTFIYFFEKHHTFYPTARAFFRYVQDNRKRVTLYTSGISLLEVLVFPLRNQRYELVKRYRTFFLKSNLVHLVDLSPAIFLAAALLRSKYNLRTPDALQVSACIHSGCDMFLTNDSQFRRVSEIKVLVLSDFLLPGNNE